RAGTKDGFHQRLPPTVARGLTVGLGRRPAASATCTTPSSHLIPIRWTPATPGISRTALTSSTAISMPSWDWRAGGVVSGRSPLASGTTSPGTCSRPPAKIATAVAHARGDLDELHRIDVIDPASFGMIAGGHIVAAHQHNVADAKRRGTEQVRLQGEPVPVADRELHDGLDPFLYQEMGRGQRRHVDMGAGVVGAVDGVDRSP